MLSRSPNVAFVGTGRDGLFRRHGFPGQGRFLGAQVLDLDQAQVGRNAVAGFQQHDVAGHELFGRDHARFAAAQGPRFGGQHVADRIERLLGAAFLNEAEQTVEDDHRENDAGVDPEAQHQLGEAGGEQHIDQNVVELAEEPDERSLFLAFGQTVRRRMSEADARLRPASRPCLRAGPETPDGVVGGHGVPWLLAAASNDVLSHRRLPLFPGQSKPAFCQPVEKLRAIPCR